MKVKNTEIVYFIDYVEKRIHLLDKSFFRFSNLPNNIGPEFQSELIEKEHLLYDVLSFEWLCYCTGGFVLVYRNHSLRIVPKDDKRLHKPFTDEIKHK